MTTLHESRPSSDDHGASASTDGGSQRTGSALPPWAQLVGRSADDALASSRSPLHSSGNGRPHLEGLLQVPILPKELANAQRAFEQVQTELLTQSRRQDEVFDYVSQIEAGLGTVAQIYAENESLHATERHQRDQVQARLAQRTEEAHAACDSVRQGTEQLSRKIERLELAAEEAEKTSAEYRALHRSVEDLRTTVNEKLEALQHVFRRVDAMEQVFEENTKLRLEVAQLRRANERRDLEMATVQGQLATLTRLMHERQRKELGGPSESPPSEKASHQTSRLDSV
eukprot:gnl/TRDRNA2_/TRDRNA2_190959_c0_seq1.p1 gnl/TRDRNA2_/TRDRNA2_190959_c0~~gnl/TRDRNA2_/TRDRNA2_190959_c0_seq1.p1  ORF type:complete len:285 (+),score=68.99 gnl/TRDRNA2_/TRDRNA2_190959_c0_seq1:138-992(+)